MCDTIVATDDLDHIIGLRKTFRLPAACQTSPVSETTTFKITTAQITPQNSRGQATHDSFPLCVLSLRSNLRPQFMTRSPPAHIIVESTTQSEKNDPVGTQHLSIL